MTFLGVLHAGFTVSDVERSVAWYTEVLGLELVHRQRGDNAYTRTLVGMDDAVVEAAQLRLPGIDPGGSTHVLELVQYVAPVGGRPSLATNEIGNGHVAFLVDDVRAQHARLTALGVAFRNPPVAITEGANRGGAACYLADPDGITVELLEPSPERKQEIARLGAPEVVDRPPGGPESKQEERVG